MTKRGLESSRKESKDLTIVQDWALAIEHGVELSPHLEATMGRRSHPSFPFPHYPQITDHMELHIRVEMQRTTCFKTETSTCDVQRGELYKVLGKLIHTKPFSMGFSVVLA